MSSGATANRALAWHLLLDSHLFTDPEALGTCAAGCNVC